MTTMAIIGAGPGLGAATAARFGREGMTIAPISRNSDNLDQLTSELAERGVQARGYTADVQDLLRWEGALERAAAELGPIEVLQYSPVPRKDFLRPALDTTVENLTAPAPSAASPIRTLNHRLALQKLDLTGLGQRVWAFVRIPGVLDSTEPTVLDP
ncbi:SDR family NAD(P)-dependent oxidoreductase [Nocardia sp. NPDC023852]|uniref:SDR family NAD(P)-dependent oxidoreductase n=1 Tax=Nocardia sp. NPDC023852 TaxID=3154697 RepID=UPI003411E11E